VAASFFNMQVMWSAIPSATTPGFCPKTFWAETGQTVSKKGREARALLLGGIECGTAGQIMKCFHQFMQRCVSPLVTAWVDIGRAVYGAPNFDCLKHFDDIAALISQAF